MEKYKFIEKAAQAAVDGKLKNIFEKHGTWSRGCDGGHWYAHCSSCNRRMNEYLYGYSHCAMCGARMDGKENET